MTISTETFRVQYAGNGGTTAFPTGFKFLTNSHVVAVLRTDSTGAEVTWAEGTNYTLTGAGLDAGGTLTALIAPTTGTTLVIYRDHPHTQVVDFPLGGDFPSDSAEQGLDRIVMQVQQLAGDVAKALHYPVTDSTSLTTILPNSTERASKFLAFDSTGAPVAAAGTSANLTPVSAFINTLLDDANAATARATLGAGDVSTSAANNYTAAQTVTLATAADNLTLTTTDAGAVGSTLRTYHNTASPANSDIPGRWNIDGKDSAGNDQTWARVEGLIADVTSASENGRLQFFTVEAGTLAARLYIGGAGGGIHTPNATGGDQGADTINAGAFFNDGVALPTGMSTAANMESALSVTTAVSPGLQHRHPGHPKAWLNYDQDTPAITADYGVTSVADDATGIFTPTFDTAFSGTTYAAVGLAEQPAATTDGFLQKRFAGSGTHTTTAMTMIHSATDGSQIDVGFLGMVWLGDQ